MKSSVLQLLHITWINCSNQLPLLQLINLFVSVSSINCFSVLRLFYCGNRKFSLQLLNPCIILNNLLVSGSSITSPLVSQLWWTWLSLVYFGLALTCQCCMKMLGAKIITIVSISCQASSWSFSCQCNSHRQTRVMLTQLTTWSVKLAAKRSYFHDQQFATQIATDGWQTFLSVKVRWHNHSVTQDTLNDF